MADYQQYKIDFENGTIPIGELTIGDRVVDPSWVWEFRPGDYYRGSGDVKTVTWIIVAKDHYDGLDPHVTMLTEELIGKLSFDCSKERGYNEKIFGCNHWGNSGTVNANSCRGLRPWLNSTGIHSGEGFYRTFSESFKQTVLLTTVPNKECKCGSAYSTQDRVFLPSSTELGDIVNRDTFCIGTVYPYFDGVGNVKRLASIGGKTCWYWTRSPASLNLGLVRRVSYIGDFLNDFTYNSTSSDPGGVRPALNLKSEILVSEIKD